MNISPIKCGCSTKKVFVSELNLENYDSKKFLIFIKTRGAIEPCLFVAYFFIMSPRAVLSFHPYTVRITFIHCMGRVRTIICKEKESWKTRRGGQITNIFFRGNIYSCWKQIWGVTGSFYAGGVYHKW